MSLSKDIERRLSKLAALEAGGVDNWEWYDESLKNWREENEKEEIAENMIDEICEVLCQGVDEPAGRGAGYGFRGDAMDQAVKIALSFVEKFNEEKAP